MKRASVLAAFRRAGFKLVDQYGTQTRYEYISSVIRVRYYPEQESLEVCRGYAGWKECSSAAEGIRYIRNVLSIQCVHNSDWALNTPRKACLELVAS